MKIDAWMTALQENSFFSQLNSMLCVLVLKVEKNVITFQIEVTEIMVISNWFIWKNNSAAISNTWREFKRTTNLKTSKPKYS